jgi:large subunit ribosomal protein L21
MLAIIKTGGKQYIVSPGDEIKIEKIKGKKEGDKVTFDQVLLIHKQRSIKIGTPFVKGAKVTANIIEEGRNKKITVFKYKPKTRYKVKKGHRQPFMKIKIDTISLSSSAKSRK